MGMTTLSVKETTADRFHEIKAELDDVQDAQDHTVDSFMQALLDTWESVGELPDDGPEAISDALTDEEVAIVGTKESVVNVIRKQLMDEGEATDTDDLAREVSKQLDYAMLADKVAEEVTGRLR